MSAEILINVRPQETRVAYLDSGIITDLKIETKSSPTLVGSIYRGKVTRVLPGMQAAFVDIGLEKAAFLYVGDIQDELDHGLTKETEEDDYFDDLSAESFSPAPKGPIQDLIKEGQYILAQVAKDPIGTKGARITTHLSLPGRFVVLMPSMRHFGVSRRISEQPERERLRQIVQGFKFSGGVIVRTAGESATEDQLRMDIDYLSRLGEEILKSHEKKKNIGLIHAELDVEQRALRDMLNENVTCVWIDDVEVHKKVKNFVAQLMPKYKHNIVYYDEKKPLFDLYDIEMEISRSMDRKVWLKSGGYIVIDEAEALVVIDVNTGRYVGKKDLEETILKTNLEAVKEIAHQLRIRNSGGIIIVDFIDMGKGTHREKVLSLLEEELQKDRARPKVISMSPLGLVEMTRKRIRPSLVKTLCEPCPYCEGKGYIKRKSTIANEIFREIERELLQLNNKHSSISVHCHKDVMDWICEVDAELLAFTEARISRSIQFKAESSYHIEQYEVFVV